MSRSENVILIKVVKEHKIGAFIVNEALSIARSKAYKAVMLDVVPDNINAQRLYEGCGFRYAGTTDLN